MRKKGSWFSAIKRVFVHNSKEKQVNEFESKNLKETKKKARGLKRGESKSFIPIFREPSSIEKILGEADEEMLFSRPPTPFEPPKTPPFLTPRASSPKPISIRVTSPKSEYIRVTSPIASSSRDINRRKEIIRYVPEPTLQYRHLSATKIQTAYRGYMVRRSFRALRGRVRLQGVVRGQNVKRQTANTMKMMQQLVRIQTQIRSQRIQMLEAQSHQHLAFKFNKEQLETTLDKWDISQSEAGSQGDWDYSTLMKEEKEARMHKKTEAALKRERTMAYAYSHQSRKSNPKSEQSPVPDNRPDGFPWRNWFERQTPATKNLSPRGRTPEPPKRRPSPNHNPPHHHIANENYESTTPTSTRSMAPIKTNRFMPTPKNNAYSNTKNFPKKDDDSLTSCPPYSVPNYMAPTISTKARADSNPKERFSEISKNDSKRRFSFPLTPNIGSFKWNKGSSKNDMGSKKALEKQQSFRSGGDFSIDSAVSMPAAVGRKPFNRFV